jgi:hypothetical protein
MERYLLGDGEGGGLLKIAPGQTWRVCQDGEHLRAQDTMGGGGKKCGVYAAGVCNHEAAEAAQAGFKGEQLRRSG